MSPLKTKAVDEVNGTLWLLKVTWFNSPPEDGTGVLKHVGVAIV